MLGNIKRGRRRRYFDDGRPVQDHGVSQGGVGRGLGKEDICLTHRRGRDYGLNHAAIHRWRHRRRAQTAHENDEKRRRKRALDAKGKGYTLGGRDPLRGRQSGERHDGEGGVGARAGGDEGRGEGVHGVEAEGGAVRVRGGDFAQVEALDGGVEGFGDEDGPRDAEVGLAGDEAGAAEVGGCADALEHRGEGDEGFGVRVGELVRAGRDGFGARGGDGRGEELDVLFFVVGDVFEVVVVGRAEAGVEEGLLRHALNAAFVKGVLQMLEREGILEDVEVRDGSLAFEWVGEGCDEEQRCCRGGGEELHAGGLGEAQWYY